MEEKISIILSTYNESLSIEKTILNLKKEIKNLELVIVDDNSPDGTFDILKKHENIKLNYKLNSLIEIYLKTNWK